MKRETITNHLLGGACTLALSFALAACGSDPDKAAKPQSEKPNPDEPAAGAADYDPSKVVLTPAQRQRAQWALLGQAFALSDPTKISPTMADLAVSPASLTNTLQALLWGTRGETALEIARLFHAEPGAADLGAAPGSGSAPAGGALGGGVSFSAGSTLWVDESFPIKEGYQQLLKERGAGNAETVNWSDLAASVGKVNGWVAETTGGKIPRILDAADIRPPVAFTIASAVAFEGSWAAQFDPEMTRTEDFARLDGEKVPAAYMSATREARYAELADGTALLELPFAGGGHRFVAALPAKSGAKPLRTLEGRIAAEAGSWLEMLKEEKVAISLPKFEVGVASDPAAALQAMGVKSIFSDNTADFTGLSDVAGLKLDVVRHHAVVKIHERGAEASGATAAVVTAKGEDPDLKAFRADRPFIFFILGDQGDVLFGGRASAPVAAAAATVPAGIETPTP